MALLFLALGDPVSSYIGVRYGKNPILGRKTLQGTLAGFVTCTACFECFDALYDFPVLWWLPFNSQPLFRLISTALRETARRGKVRAFLKHLRCVDGPHPVQACRWRCSGMASRSGAQVTRAPASAGRRSVIRNREKGWQRRGCLLDGCIHNAGDIQFETRTLNTRPSILTKYCLEISDL